MRVFTYIPVPYSASTSCTQKSHVPYIVKVYLAMQWFAKEMSVRNSINIWVWRPLYIRSWPLLIRSSRKSGEAYPVLPVFYLASWADRPGNPPACRDHSQSPVTMVYNSWLYSMSCTYIYRLTIRYWGWRQCLMEGSSWRASHILCMFKLLLWFPPFSYAMLC